MNQIYRKSPGVFAATGSITCINNDDLLRIKEDAYASRLRRSRICVHESADDPVQEMIIAICQDSYIAPHKHVGKTESFHVIEGQADIYFFDACGKMMEMITNGMDANEALEKASGQYGRVDDAVKLIDPRHE